VWNAGRREAARARQQRKYPRPDGPARVEIGSNKQQIIAAYIGEALRAESERSSVAQARSLGHHYRFKTGLLGTGTSGHSSTRCSASHLRQLPWRELRHSACVFLQIRHGIGARCVFRRLSKPVTSIAAEESPAAQGRGQRKSKIWKRFLRLQKGGSRVPAPRLQSPDCTDLASPRSLTAASGAKVPSSGARGIEVALALGNFGTVETLVPPRAPALKVRVQQNLDGPSNNFLRSPRLLGSTGTRLH